MLLGAPGCSSVISEAHGLELEQGMSRFQAHMGIQEKEIMKLEMERALLVDRDDVDQFEEKQLTPSSKQVDLEDDLSKLRAELAARVQEIQERDQTIQQLERKQLERMLEERPNEDQDVAQESSEHATDHGHSHVTHGNTW